METQTPTARIGSLEIFWPLIEPILAALQPQRICEIGVDAGALTERLIAWAEPRHCAYVGIDPAPELAVRERFADDGRLLLQTSHAALPNVEPCDVYFLDGDHNYFTVLGELTLIAAARQPSRSPVIFMHDVAWPWGRRDMYYLPTTVPADARHPSSETLGVALDGDELIEGGVREPGRYAIALRPGGPRNGVLTAAEDFLATAAGAGWAITLLPMAYGLAVLHRPDDPALSDAAKERLSDLRTMAATGGAFLQACEQNFLRLYLYGEYHQHAAATERIDHHATLEAYDRLLVHDRAIEGTFRNLEEEYKKILAHSEALSGEYQKLLTSYEELWEYAGLPQPPPPGDQLE